MSVLGLALTAGAVLVVLASLALGSRSIPLAEVLGSLFTDAHSDNATVITTQRLPRTALGLLVGVALGVAGSLMQGHTRNPLADPGLFGVNAGSAFGVAFLVFALDVQSPAAIVVAALVGAAAVTVTVFVFGLGRLRGGALVMLAIVGTTLGEFLSAMTSSLVLLDRDTLNVLRFWEVGAISNRDYSLIAITAPLMLLGLLLAVLNGFSLNALGLGDEVAESLGTSVRTSRIVGIGAITLLAGPATAMCGPIAFVGLVAPHAARVLAGHDYRWLVPFSGVIGATLLLMADTIGRVSAGPGELQAGIVMAVIGAPVLLAVSRRWRQVAL